MNDNKKNILIFVGIVIVGVIGVYGIISVNENQDRLNKVIHAITKECKEGYLEERYLTIEDCIQERMQLVDYRDREV